MLSSITGSQSAIQSQSNARNALGLEFSLSGTQGSWNPEQSEPEKAAAEAKPITVPRQLTAEEKERVEFLQDQLESLLQELAENPSDDKKGRIREIEAELAKITGVKTRSRLSDMASKVPQKTDEEEDQQRKATMLTQMDPAMLETAIAGKTLPKGSSDGPGLMSQMMRAAGSYDSMNLQNLAPLAGSVLSTKA